ncbi:replication initiation protein [Vibrio nereis]|uniref:replication initiation protein n=1 Tax=Vibrio nereis TaxID=693 RepID=UPI0024953756|nr:replication initiation protein [Vibrio nereis]
MEDLTVVHANELVEASYNLSINEIRVIALACAKVDSRKKNPGEIHIYVSDFAKTYGLTSNKRIYSDLRDAVRGVMRKPVKLYDSERDRFNELAWLVKNEYESGEDGTYVSILFSPLIEPYLFELKERFTKVNFEYASRLNTPFSFRLYQWLKEAENLHKNKKGNAVIASFEVEWMKTQASMDGSYERWDHFNERVIKPSIARINANTDLSVIYKPVKTGRRVTAVDFTYVVEVASIERPLRPRLARRPKVMKGSHDEGVWMRKNLALLLDYESKLKKYDPEAKLSLPDLRKMAEYAVIAEPELKARLDKEIRTRTSK